jgi:hypothetical protein
MEGHQKRERDESMKSTIVNLFMRGFVIFKWYTLDERRVLNAISFNLQRYYGDV